MRQVEMGSARANESVIPMRTRSGLSPQMERRASARSLERGGRWGSRTPPPQRSEASVSEGAGGGVGLPRKSEAKRAGARGPVGESYSPATAKRSERLPQRPRQLRLLRRGLGAVRPLLLGDRQHPDVRQRAGDLQ